MVPLLGTIALLIIGSSPASCDTCQSQLPSGIDRSICDQIQATVFVFRYAIRDIDEKVKETVIVALKEAREILDSTSATTIEDVRSILYGTRRKRSTVESPPDDLRTVIDKAEESIEKAINTAEKKIRTSIARSVESVNIQNDPLKNESVLLLRKILAKRSISPDFRNSLKRRDLHSDIQSALSAASDEVKTAMKEAVIKSIHEYKRMMDYFAPLLKALFKEADLKGDVDQGEQDIEQLAIKASIGFVKFYESFSEVTIRKAVTSVEELLSKFQEIGKRNPNALNLLRGVLQQESQHVTEVVETTKEPDEEIRQMVNAAAEKMLTDFKSVKALIRKKSV